VFRRRGIVAAFAFAALVAAAVHVAFRPDPSFPTLPAKFTDADFWDMVTNFSESGGYFRSDNFVSNETTFQWVIPELSKKLKRDGVYLGVGPDQNFTYIAAIHPAVAFITDIRRQNMLLHLMYKALFEISRSRTEFLSKLFGRPIPGSLKERDSLDTLFQAFGDEESDPILGREAFAAIMDRLREGHHFRLNTEDAGTIEYVHNAFVSAGPDIRYSFPSQYSGRRFPSYSDLMLESDSNGENHSYLASEENFQTVKHLELENRIIPIIGDFAGGKALRSVGRYLKQHGSSVTAFYTSNVEFYLFQSDDWRKFFNNVSDLPVDPNSVFIRTYFNNYGRYASGSNARSETLLDGIQDLTVAYKANEIHGYIDIIRRSTAP
jgi:hypothetical protein